MTRIYRKKKAAITIFTCEGGFKCDRLGVSREQDRVGRKKIQGGGKKGIRQLGKEGGDKVYWKILIASLDLSTIKALIWVSV